MKSLLTRIPGVGAIGIALVPYATVMVASSLGVSLRSTAAAAAFVVFSVGCCLVSAFAVRRSDARVAGMLAVALVSMNGLLILGQGCSACSSKGVGH